MFLIKKLAGDISLGLNDAMLQRPALVWVYLHSYWLTPIPYRSLNGSWALCNAVWGMN